jgi:hypothetical protein
MSLYVKIVSFFSLFLFRFILQQLNIVVKQNKDQYKIFIFNQLYVKEEEENDDKREKPNNDGCSRRKYNLITSDPMAS